MQLLLCVPLMVMLMMTSTVKTTHAQKAVATTWTIVEGEDYYGILVDAGSSSSKVKLYKWSLQKATTLPKIDLVNSTKVKPSISSFSDDPDALGPYVDYIIRWARDLVPTTKQRATPFYIMATSGMRFLDSSVTYAVMTSLRNRLSNTTRNPFAASMHDDVSVLSGNEEGVYSWIAANYLNGYFDGEVKSIDESVGVLEMGGGSTQITFIPKGPLYAGEFQISLAHHKYSLYSHSYLDFGTNAIANEVQHALRMKASPAATSIKDPCMLKGDDTTLTLDKNHSVTFVGDGDAQSCRDLFSGILKPAQGIECQPKPCAIRDFYQPSIGNGTFYATSAFAYAPGVLDAVRDDKTLDIGAMVTNTVGYCNMTIAEAYAKFPQFKLYLSDYCRAGAYFPRLFQNYGFTLDTTNIILSSKINSQNIDWALGAMLIRLSDRFANTKGTFGVVCPQRGTSPGNGGASSLSRVQFGSNIGGLLLILVMTGLVSMFWTRL